MSDLIDVAKLMVEAADEIDRLRAENERLRGALGSLLRLLDGPGYILREAQAIEFLGSGPIVDARAALDGDGTIRDGGKNE